MMKKWQKALTAVGVLALGVVGLAACGNNGATKESDSETASKEIVVGVCPGPYGDMIEQVIAPLAKEKGYTLTTKLFNDYVQPNNALDTEKIGANLFQHTAYLEKFSEDNNLDLTAVGTVPTLGMGIYSNDLKSLDDLKDGAKASIPNDASNLARALQLLAKNDLITIKDSVDETKATVDDIDENPKNLDFKPLEAGQLSRSLDNVDIALVPGNFSWAAKLDPADALVLEELQEQYKNVFVVRSSEADGDFGKAMKDILAGQEFKNAIKASDFKDFEQPDSWK